MITPAHRELVTGDLIIPSPYSYSVGDTQLPERFEDEPCIVVMTGSINLGHESTNQDNWVVCLAPNGILIESLCRLSKCITRVKV